MARLKIYKDNSANSTVICNRFIDEYMTDANDAQLKVYLYLLRMLGANQPTSVSDIADKFNHTEKDVLRALKYWEKKQLLTLDYDASGIPTGIHFKDLDAESVSQSDASTSQTLIMSMDSPDPEPIVMPKPLYKKPVYSQSQLREFKEHEDTSQLLYIAEQYIGRPLTPAEMRSILFFTDELHFSVDLIDYLIAYCVDRGKKDFKYIEKVAISWAEQEITTPDQARGASQKYNKNIYTIMNALGRNNAPTDTEAKYITRWIGEYGFDMDIILEACERTVVATDSHRLEYAERMLSSWHENNVHQKADIHRIDELYQKKKGNAKPQSNNKFNKFSQNSYDFEALEKELLRK